MPICTQCGGEDFDEDCGHFFCQVCQVQSQDIRVEETEFEDFHNVTVTKTPVPKSKVFKNQVDNKGHLGRPWTIQEGYQCIIKKQVEKLILLGADPKLDEIVFRLWTAYLSSLSVAFCEKELLVPSSLHLLARPRETHCGPVHNPIVKVPVEHKNREPSQNEIDNLQIRQELGSEEFYKGDNPTNIDKKRERTVCLRRANPTTFGPMKTRLKYSVEWMNLSETLSFLYLGLLFTNNHVTPSQIISLAERDEIPFSSAINCLKENMKISAYDQNLFYATVVPTTSSLRKTTAKLIRFLGIYELPPLPIETITSNLILKVDLPAGFHGLVSNLLNKVRLDLSVNAEIYAVKNVELMAVCYIIITLKLFFGFNDSREHFLTDCARKLSKLLPSHNFFIWEDWQSHISSKFKIKQQIVNNNIQHPGQDVTNIDEFVKFYQTSVRCKNVGVDREKNKKQYEAVIDPISELASRSKYLESIVLDEPVESSNLFDVLSKSVDDGYQYSPESEERKRGAMLHSSSIKYLGTTDDLHREVTNINLMGQNVKSCYCSSREQNNLDMDIEFTQQKENRKRKITEKKKQNVETILSEVNVGLTDVTQCVRDEIEFIMEKIHEESGIYSEYKVQEKVQTDNAVKDKYKFQRHLSYEWLLSVFCKVIKCRVDDLEVMLANFEYFVLNRDTSLEKPTKMQTSFKGIYFQSKCLKKKKKK